MIWNSFQRRFAVEVGEQMKSLVIGAGGFVGAYLIRHLLEDENQTIYATKMDFESIDVPSTVHLTDLDILDKSAVCSLLSAISPDCIYHLAALSSVALSWAQPQKTVDINIKGLINLLDAIRECNLAPRILLIGSSEEYGAVRPEDLPIKEDAVLRPKNMYAVTKATQNYIGQIYHEAYQMDIVMARAFNHVGPKQSPQFVVSDFCRQVAEIEKGRQEPTIRVGNLSAKRDFTDVRDIVRGYKLLTEKGQAGEVYNIGSSLALSIEDILHMIISSSSLQIEIEVDKDKLRPVDIPVIRADISKIACTTGWKPLIPIEQTIQDTLAYWRK